MGYVPLDPPSKDSNMKRQWLPKWLRNWLFEVEPSCPYCDGTGDVHSPTGEWRGICKCPAGSGRCAPFTPKPVKRQPAPEGFVQGTPGSFNSVRVANEPTSSPYIASTDDSLRMLLLMQQVQLATIAQADPPYPAPHPAPTSAPLACERREEPESRYEPAPCPTPAPEPAPAPSYSYDSPSPAPEPSPSPSPSSWD